tara:strand:+ start:606 stop:851 length:246 start_codon:yes stop_codon:yes gene_type:complete
MKNFGASEILILASAIMSYSNLNMSIAALSLGIAGAVIRYSVNHNEKQEKAKEIEGVAENFSSIISGLASGMNQKDRNNLH